MSRPNSWCGRVKIRDVRIILWNYWTGHYNTSHTIIIFNLRQTIIFVIRADTESDIEKRRRGCVLRTRCDGVGPSYIERRKREKSKGAAVGRGRRSDFRLSSRACYPQRNRSRSTRSFFLFFPNPPPLLIVLLPIQYEDNLVNSVYHAGSPVSLKFFF